MGAVENGKIRSIVLPAVMESYNKLMSFLEETLEEMGCPLKEMMIINVAADEIIANIISYAYEGSSGDLSIEIEELQNPRGVSICFSDRGIPFDPLKKPDPEIHLSAEEREIGGLGIFMVKKTMDGVEYNYSEGNHFRIKKFF